MPSVVAARVIEPSSATRRKYFNRWVSIAAQIYQPYKFGMMKAVIGITSRWSHMSRSIVSQIGIAERLERSAP